MISWMEGFRHCYAAAENLGSGEGTNDRILAGDSGGHPADVSPRCWSPSAAGIETTHPVQYQPRIRALHSADVDGDSLADRHSDQHRRDRADLSQCRSRTQPWHSVLPGATLATAMWFLATTLFGWYLQSYADYSVIYGSLGVGIALLVWMYMISLVMLIGAEFNAMLFPRAFLGKELLESSTTLGWPHAEPAALRSKTVSGVFRDFGRVAATSAFTSGSSKEIRSKRLETGKGRLYFQANSHARTPPPRSRCGPIPGTTTLGGQKSSAPSGPPATRRRLCATLCGLGMDVARLNFSHGSHEEHARNIARIRRAARKEGRTICILQDLQGPKIRTGRLKDRTNRSC